MTTDHVGDKIARYLPGSTASHLQERRNWLRDTAAADAEQAMSSYGRQELRRQAEDIAKAALGRAEHAFRQKAATEKDVLEARAALKREREHTAKLQIEIAEIQQRAHDSKAVLDRVNQFLGGLAWPIEKKPIEHYGPTKLRLGQSTPFETEGSAPDIQVVRAGLPDGIAPFAAIAAQRDEIARLHGEIADVDHAVDRLESAERRLPALVEELAQRGAPELAGAGEPGARLSIRGPKMDLGAEPRRNGSGNIPKGDDALALLAWLAPERVLEKLRADLHEAYSAVDVQLDPHEKSRRRREIKAAILEAERIEAAAGWALIEQGDDTVRFRPDADPRAVLGIA